MKEDLKISVTRKIINIPDKNIIDKQFEKQNYKCAYCDIDIKKYGKINPIDEDNFEGLCSVCYASQHLEILNDDCSGSIVMLNNISQLELIELSRMIELIKRIDPEKFSDDIDSVMVIKLLLDEGANNSNMYYSQSASDVNLISQLLLNLTTDIYEKREDGLFLLKWLPDYSMFSKELDYWYSLYMKNENSKYHPSKWESMLKKYKK